MGPFHFKIELDGLRDQGSLHGVSHGMKWIMFHDLPVLHQALLTQNHEIVTLQNLTNLDFDIT